MKIVSYNSNPRNKTLVIISGLAVIVLFALLIHPRSFNVSDVDVFYHIRHSWIYSQNGLTFSEFPWTQFSVIKEYSADLWYGFHVLSVPLTYFNNLLDGMWVGGLIVTTSALLIIWFALRRLPIKWPLLLTLIISLLSADFLYRLTMFRPHPITVGLTLLLFSFFCMPAKRMWISVFIASFFFAWMHLSLAWVPIAVWIAINFSQLLQKT